MTGENDKNNTPTNNFTRLSNKINMNPIYTRNHLCWLRTKDTTISTSKQTKKKEFLSILVQINMVFIMNIYQLKSHYIPLKYWHFFSRSDSDKTVSSSFHTKIHVRTMLHKHISVVFAAGAVVVVGITIQIHIEMKLRTVKRIKYSNEIQILIDSLSKLVGIQTNSDGLD